MGIYLDDASVEELRQTSWNEGYRAAIHDARAEDEILGVWRIAEVDTGASPAFILVNVQDWKTDGDIYYERIKAEVNADALNEAVRRERRSDLAESRGSVGNTLDRRG